MRYTILQNGKAIEKLDGTSLKIKKCPHCHRICVLLKHPMQLKFMNDLKIKSSIFNNINIKIKLMNSVATIHNIILHAQLYAFTLIFHNCLDS